MFRRRRSGAFSQRCCGSYLISVRFSQPYLRWRSEPLPELQRDLLGVAAERAKPGGSVVYSVCTLNAEENEQVLDSSGLEVEPLVADWPQFAHPRRPEFLLTRPDRDRTSGFFIACMRPSQA